MTHKAIAYAKVNLHLEVLNKRSDSYHNIFSLNASLDLFDLLTFRQLNIFSNKFKDIRIDIHPEGGEYGDIITSIKTEDNLVSKAVKSYLNRIGKSGEISISIEKNIPAGAGLGGGSSDAAASLRLLNNYFIKSGEGLLEDELLGLGARIGADIPYCLKGGYALCEGIGDVIENIEGKLSCWILVANCGIMVNTADAYNAFASNALQGNYNALKRNGKTALTDTGIEEKKYLIREGIKKDNFGRFKDILKNDFEAPVFSKHPELRSIKEEIVEYQPEYVTMTGTGSSIIGLFKDKENAERAREGLSEKAKVLIARFL